MQESPQRYGAVSIALHWIIVALVAVNVWAGGGMEEAAGADLAGWLALHKSVGLAILLLMLARLAWRLTHRWPPLPDPTPGWQRAVARITHVSFYVLLIAAPLFGWATVSASTDLPAGGPPNLPLPDSEALAETLGEIHKLLVKALYAVIALHVLGALKHYFIDRDEVLPRMLPILPRLKK